MSRRLGRLTRILFLVVMLAGSGLITAMSLPYFDFDALPPFIVEKLPVRFESLWLASLRIHVAAAALSFPLCIALMTRALQRRPPWHRLLGRAAGILVLFALVPTGVVLAFDAKGGAPVTAGFLLSAAIVAWGIVHGVTTARRRDLLAHSRAMRHVLAQMSVAVTSRALMIALDAQGMDPELAYVVALWGPVLASAAVAEALSFRAPVRVGGRFTSFATLIQRIRPDVLPSSGLVRARAVVRPVARLGR